MLLFFWTFTQFWFSVGCFFSVAAHAPKPVRGKLTGEVFSFPVNVFGLNVEQTTFFGSFYFSNVDKTIHSVLFYMVQYPLLSYGLKPITKYTENSPTSRSPTDSLRTTANIMKPKITVAMLEMQKKSPTDRQLSRHGSKTGPFFSKHFN
jgi:hypothetical protein